MIGSGTQADPWVPLTAAELKDCWSNRGGYIELTCDIDMGEIVLGDPKTSPAVRLNLRGFSVTVKKEFRELVIICENDNRSEVSNGVIVVAVQGSGKIGLKYGDAGSVWSNLIVQNHSFKKIAGAHTNSLNVFFKSVIVNHLSVFSDFYSFAGCYQNSGSFYIINKASPSHIYEMGLPDDVFFIESIDGKSNISIKKKSKTYVSGKTLVNGGPVTRDVFVATADMVKLWSSKSLNNGDFKVDLGRWDKPVFVIASDPINKELLPMSRYVVGDVVVMSSNMDIKLTCTVSGDTGELIPDITSNSGVITIGTASFELSDLAPASVKGPMFPAKAASVKVK
nr:hypothetical protein [Plesiomonas shigelloides]